MKTKVIFFALAALISELSLAGLANSKTYPLNTHLIVRRDIVVPAYSKSLNLEGPEQVFPHTTKIKSCELTYESAMHKRHLRRGNILPTNGVEIQKSDLSNSELIKFITDLGGKVENNRQYTREEIVDGIYSLGGIVKMKSGEDLQIRIPVLTSNGGNLGRAIQCKLFGEISSPDEVILLLQESLTEIAPNDSF